MHVDTHKADPDIMGDIGHELRHTIEVLSDPTIRSNAKMHLFYAFNAPNRSHGRTRSAFETDAATEAGMTVGAELRLHSPRSDAH